MISFRAENNYGSTRNEESKVRVRLHELLYLIMTKCAGRFQNIYTKSY